MIKFEHWAQFKDQTVSKTVELEGSRPEDRALFHMLVKSIINNDSDHLFEISTPAFIETQETKEAE